MYPIRVKWTFFTLFVAIASICTIPIYANSQPEDTSRYISEGELAYGIKQGWWILYYKDTGTVFCEGFFKDNQVEGTWKMYDKDGRIICTTEFSNGIVKRDGNKCRIPPGWLNNIRSVDKNLAPKSGTKTNTNRQKTKGLPLYAKSVGNKWGFVDANEEMVIEPIYDDAWHFHEGYAPIKMNGKIGIINSAGDIIVKPSFDDICHRYGYGRWCFKVGDKWGYIDASGNTVIKPVYDGATIFEDMVTEVMLNNKYGLIDINGNLLTYYYSKNIDRLEPAQLFGKWGFNKSGKIVIEPIYIKAGEFSCGLANVNIDGTWGFINEKGNLVIKNDFDDARIFSEGIAGVKKDGKWGYIGEDGNFLIQPQYSYCWDFKKGKAKIRDDASNEKFIDRFGKAVAD